MKILTQVKLATLICLVASSNASAAQPTPFIAATGHSITTRSTFIMANEKRQEVVRVKCELDDKVYGPSQYELFPRENYDDCVYVLGEGCHLTKLGSNPERYHLVCKRAK